MTKERLILVGGGRFGREVAAWVAFLNLPFQVQGYIDDEKQSEKIIGPILNHTPVVGAVYLTSMGNGTARKKLRLELEARGAIFTDLVDPLVRSVSPLARGRNNIYLGNISIANDVSLGSDVQIHGFTTIGHDVTIEDGVTVGAHGFIGGGAVLKERCTVHPSAAILPDVIVGEGAVVGAGAVVIKHVAAYTTVFGAPAKVIAYGKRP